MDKQKSGMTSILVAYDYCNLGGVTSVFKQRLRMMPVLMPTFHFMFAKDLGGRAELLGLDGVRVDLCPNGEFRNWVTNHLLCAKPQTIEAVILIDQPEILHAMVEGGFFSKPDRPRVVYEIHTSLERTFTRMLDVDFRMVDSIVVPSRWLKRKVQELLPTLPVDLITIIPNFIDRTLFEMLDETDATLSDAAAPLVVWIGKLVADKNFVDACKIMKQLSTRRKIKPVFVSGGAAEQPQVVDFLSTLALHGLIDDAFWIANLPNYDVPKLLNRARRTGGLFLSTSKFESFGLSILEALSCGLPAVAAGVGGVPEVIENGYGGYLFDVGENAEAASLCELVLENPLEHSRAAHASSIRFDGTSIASTYRDIVIGL